MLSSVKQGVKQLLHAAGTVAHRFHPDTSPLARLMVSLRHSHIDLVIDIGANEGQFAKELRAGGYSGRIVSFEPLLAAHGRLLQESNSDSAWHVHARCALGDRLGEIELNISGNSVSSSILPMLTSHSIAAPESAYLGHESAPLITLDSVAPPYLEGAQAPFLKIDTQGMFSTERVQHCQGYAESRWSYLWCPCTKVSASGGSVLNVWRQKVSCCGRYNRCSSIQRLGGSFSSTGCFTGNPE